MTVTSITSPITLPVYSVNEDGQPPYTSIEGPGKLATPTLSAGTPGSTSVPLSWPYTDDGQTGFEIQRSTDNATWTTITTTSNIARSHTASGLTAETLYYFRIRAIDAVETGRNSNWSASVSATTAAQSAGTDLDGILDYIDFESAALGATVNSSSPFDSSPGTVQNDPLGINGKVARDTMVTGREEWAWGGIYAFPQHLVSGDEAWASVEIMWPAGFDPTAGPWLKFMRWRTETSSGSNAGYNDMYLYNTGQSPWNFIFEGENNWKNVSSNNATRPPYGEWCRFEMHVVFDDVPVSAGGAGRVDFWRNGVLVGSVTDRRTMNSDSHVCPSFYLFTYWNGGSPANQSAYWDKFAIAVKTSWRDDTAHMVTDAGGRPYIGVIA